MSLRLVFTLIYFLLVTLLSLCAMAAYRSKRSIGKPTSLLCLSLIMPVIGNLLILGSTVKAVAMVGSYLYFLGMDFLMFALVNFTNKYCTGLGDGSHKPTVVYAALVLDAVQIMLNPFLHHTFDRECVDLRGLPYYKLVPFLGQKIHRVVDFVVLFAVILIFFLASVKTAKIYRERYTILLGCMLAICVWEAFCIFSRTPVDTSMIGLGCFGLVVFYLAIWYRPLKLLDKMLSNIASDMTEALYVYDPFGKCIWANRFGIELVGVEENDLEKVTEGLTAKFGERSYVTTDWSINRVLGTGDNASYYYIQNRSVSDDDRHIAGSFLIIRDNTEEQRRLKRELYNSTHDSLTGLYTKQYLYECIKTTLENDRGTAYLAIFVDVKNFKIVNDVFSAQFGDIALKQIADSIRKGMTEKCVYGRLAGDTFGIFMPAETFKPDVVEKFLTVFTVTDGSIEHKLLLHLGVYEVSDKDTDVSVMFDRAHLALSTITDEYKTHIAWYDKKLRDKVLWDQRITSMLGDAIEQMQIRPYLQPITDSTGRVVGAEALARWIHPDLGFLPPSEFIPIFEKNGLIVEVDKHMWRCACNLLNEWKGEHDDLFISVNISPKDFFFTDVLAEIKSLAEEYGTDHSKLRIEITETVMMTDAEERMKTLEQFRSEGFIVEMDDFGSGYSSLNLLKDMPVDILKLDMKFLSSDESNRKARTILANIIRLTEELGISSLTEGVETEQQYHRLKEMGCTLFQGYFFAKPMPAEEFTEFVKARSGGK